jgi:beta-phosphoglucomutase family hydrolase
MTTTAATLDVARFDAVVFDMDGVITDTASVHAAAWKQMFDAVLQEQARSDGGAFEPFGPEDYLRYVDGRPRDDGVEAFLRSRNISLPRGSADDGPDVESVWGLANRKNADFLRRVDEGGARTFPTSVALVRELQARGVGTAIISASRNCKRILDAAGIGDLFPVRVDGLELERLGLPGKPDPAMFFEAARRLDAAPERSAVVEDAIAGVEAGRRGSFALVIGVDRGGNAAALRDHGADVVVDDLAAISVTR